METEKEKTRHNRRSKNVLATDGGIGKLDGASDETQKSIRTAKKERGNAHDEKMHQGKAESPKKVAPIEQSKSGAGYTVRSTVIEPAAGNPTGDDNGGPYYLDSDGCILTKSQGYSEWCEGRELADCPDKSQDSQGKDAEFIQAIEDLASITNELNRVDDEQEDEVKKKPKPIRNARLIKSTLPVSHVKKAT